MLKVAESIRTSARSELKATSIPLNETFQKMETKFGYNLLEPGILPPGYEFNQVEQVPGRPQVDAYYRPSTSDETGPRLTISQIPLSTLPKMKSQNYPQDIVEMVDILGNQGRFMKGANDGSGSNPGWFLFWETKDLALSIWYYPGPKVEEKAAREMLIKIAESMR
jgi:hypothetical protein